MATYDEEQFSMNKGLLNLRLDVTQITNKEVNVKEINVFYGSRQRKNGWKYNEHPRAKVVQHVGDLYQHINGKPKVLNNQINLGFMRVIVVESKCFQIKWVGYAIHTFNF
jgi:hypothetical protein